MNRIALALALFTVACGVVDENASNETGPLTVETQLLQRDFLPDPTKPPGSVEESMETTAIRYVHPDGRAAVLLRDEATGAEQGAIFDPQTQIALEELVPYPGDVAASGCPRNWIEWKWSGWAVWSSNCNGETGTLCMTFYPLASVPGAPNGSFCEEVSCACSGGGDGPYHQTPN
jgi:hypothetical protein